MSEGHFRGWRVWQLVAGLGRLAGRSVQSLSHLTGRCGARAALWCVTTWKRVIGLAAAIAGLGGFVVTVDMFRHPTADRSVERFKADPDPAPEPPPLPSALAVFFVDEPDDKKFYRWPEIATGVPLALNGPNDLSATLRSERAPEAAFPLLAEQCDHSRGLVFRTASTRAARSDVPHGLYAFEIVSNRNDLVVDPRILTFCLAYRVDFAITDRWRAADRDINVLRRTERGTPMVDRPRAASIRYQREPYSEIGFGQKLLLGPHVEITGWYTIARHPDSKRLPALALSLAKREVGARILIIFGDGERDIVSIQTTNDSASDRESTLNRTSDGAPRRNLSPRPVQYDGTTDNHFLVRLDPVTVHGDEATRIRVFLDRIRPTARQVPQHERVVYGRHLLDRGFDELAIRLYNNGSVELGHLEAYAALPP